MTQGTTGWGSRHGTHRGGRMGTPPRSPSTLLVTPATTSPRFSSREKQLGRQGRQDRGARKGTHRSPWSGLAAASHPKLGLAVSTLPRSWPVQHCAHGEASFLLSLLALRPAPTHDSIPSHSKFMATETPAYFPRRQRTLRAPGKVEPFCSPIRTDFRDNSLALPQWKWARPRDVPR